MYLIGTCNMMMPMSKKKKKTNEYFLVKSLHLKSKDDYPCEPVIPQLKIFYGNYLDSNVCVADKDGTRASESAPVDLMEEIVSS